MAMEPITRPRVDSSTFPRAAKKKRSQRVEKDSDLPNLDQPHTKMEGLLRRRETLVRTRSYNDFSSEWSLHKKKSDLDCRQCQEKLHIERTKVQKELEDIQQKSEDFVRSHTLAVSPENKLSRKLTNYQLALREGKRRFNAQRTGQEEGGSEGIRYLINLGLLNDTSEDIAVFLFQNSASLNKEQIGKYLSHHKSRGVMLHFVGLHEIKDCSLLEALRQFVQHLTLPKEPHKVYNLMEQFELYFNRVNPKRSKDTSMGMAFSLVMLSNNLHNPKFKEKIKLERFIDMHMRSRISFDKDLLEEFYYSVLEEPIIKLEEHSYEGRLLFDSKKMVFVLSEGHLKYRSVSDKPKPKYYHINLSNVRLKIMDSQPQRLSKPGCKFEFELYTLSGSVGIPITHGLSSKLDTSRANLKLAAESEAERKEWTHHLQAVISDHQQKRLKSDIRFFKNAKSFN